MARLLAIFGFGGGFLALSPRLREDTLEALSGQLDMLARHSPYSYAAVAAFGLVSMLIYIRRCSAPR